MSDPPPQPQPEQPEETDPTQVELLNRLKAAEEVERNRVHEEMAKIKNDFLQKVNNFYKSQQETVSENSPENTVIPDEEEEKKENCKKKIGELERVLKTHLQKLIEETEENMKKIQIQWENVRVEEENIEESIESIKDGYDEQLKIFETACSSWLKIATLLRNEVINAAEQSASVLINFLYIAIVPMEDIVKHLKNILDLIDQLKNHDQNCNMPLDALVESLSKELTDWLHRDNEIQVKHFDFMNALRDRPEDQKLEEMKQFMEQYFELEKTSPRLLRLQLLSNVKRSDKLKELELQISTCIDFYSQLAKEMRTFFEDSFTDSDHPGEHHVMF